MRTPRIVVLATLVAALAAPVAATPGTDCGPPPDGAICGEGPWFDFAAMTVYTVQGPSRSRYEIVIGAGRDLKVVVNENNPSYQGRAEAMLIDGSVLATRGEGNLPNRGADLLNDPLLAAQEVSTLLQAALPKGPRSISKPTPVRATDSRFIVARTPMMTSYYGPPWKVEGTVSPAANSAYSFDLTLTFRVATPDGTVSPREHVHHYSGRASYPAKRPRISDNTSLAGWTFDLPNAQDMRFSTLGEARRALGVAPAR